MAKPTFRKFCLELLFCKRISFVFIGLLLFYALIGFCFYLYYASLNGPYSLVAPTPPGAIYGWHENEYAYLKDTKFRERLARAMANSSSAVGVGGYFSVLREVSTLLSGSCSSDYGLGLLERMDRTKMTMCDDGDVAASNFATAPTALREQETSGQGVGGYGLSTPLPGASRITCLQRTGFPVPRRLCLAHFAQIDSNARVKMEVGCRKSPAYARTPPSEWVTSTSLFMKEFKTTYDAVNVDSKPLKCDNFVNHTVFFFQRWDATNGFHFLEDVVTTFESLLALGLSPDEVQILIVDDMESRNSLAQFWTRFFGFPMRVVPKEPFPPNTCFARAVFNMHAGISHLSMNNGVSRNNPCYPSGILFALRTFVKKKMQLLAGNATISPPSHRTILFVARRHPHSRVIPNEVQLLNFLRGRLNASRWRLAVYIPEQVATIDEQLATVSSADIIVGVHGAGLAGAVFMEPGRHMIEIFHSSRNVENRHYYNLCHWAGLKYSGAGYYATNVDAETLWSKLAPAIADVEKQLDGG